MKHKRNFQSHHQKVIKEIYNHILKKMPKVSEEDALKILKGYTDHYNNKQDKSIYQIKNLAKKYGLKLSKEEFQQHQLLGNEWYAIFQISL